MNLRIGFALAALVLAPSSANAKWYEATSRHFNVYSQQSPEDLLAYASKLERYDSAVRAVRKMADPANAHDRLTVYVIKDGETIERLYGAPGSGVLGFWQSRAAGPVAFANSQPKRARYDLDGQTVFFHEYLHHMMLQDAVKTYPTWMSEGYAEFFAPTEFHDDGSVEIGKPPQYRGWELHNVQGMPLVDMLGGIYNQTTYREWVSQYGRGWLLTHYLAFEPSRQGQVDRYVNAINSGVPALDAAKKAFGDLKKLDKELNAYLARKTIPTRTIPASLIKVGPVDVRPLRDDEAEAVEASMWLDANDDVGVARAAAGRARKAAQQFPSSAIVLSTLARAEFEAKHYSEASAAADRALAIDPKSLQASVYKGRALMELAKDNPASANWQAIRGWFSKANHIDPEAPEPLMLYFQSFVKQGVKPPSQAVDGLLAAIEDSPRDVDMRLMAVLELVKEGDTKTAQLLYGPVAYDPHSGKEHRRGLEIMEKIKSGDTAGAISMLEEDQKKREKNA